MFSFPVDIVREFCYIAGQEDGAMSKQILILTGSPRPNGNSFLLAEAFKKGAEEAGHTVHRFDTAHVEIDGCRACNQCYQHGKACVFDDDFNLLAPHLEKADVLVLATPLYWFSFPAQLKAALDKAILTDGMYIPREKSVDYSSGESFQISQLSDAAQKRWPSAKEWGMSAEEYARYYPICSASGKKKEEIIQDLVNAGMTQEQANTFWKIVKN